MALIRAAARWRPIATDQVGRQRQPEWPWMGKTTVEYAGETHWSSSACWHPDLEQIYFLEGWRSDEQMCHFTRHLGASAFKKGLALGGVGEGCERSVGISSTRKATQVVVGGSSSMMARPGEETLPSRAPRPS